VWIATFALTVFADLTVAVEVGMILAALLYIRRVAATTTVSRVTAEAVDEDRVHVLQDKRIPSFATVIRIHGPLLFGTTDKLRHLVDGLEKATTVVIVRLRNMTALDATGLRALEDLAVELRASGRGAIFCGAREQPLAVMRQSGFMEMVGPENVCPNIDAALARAYEVSETHSLTSGVVLPNV